MEIKNAKIKNVTQRLDNLVGMIVSMEFHEELETTIFAFKLANHIEVKNLTNIMKFMEVQEFKDLEEKVVRIAFCEDSPVAIGHPVEDRFVDIGNTSFVDLAKELSISELLEEYPIKT